MAAITSLIFREVDGQQLATRAGRSLLKERYGALQRHIPLIYVIIFTNFVGLQLTSSGTTLGNPYPASIVALVMAVRLAHWVRRRGEKLEPEAVLQELRKTLVFSGALSLAFCAWAFEMLLGSIGGQDLHVVLFASLAALSCAYGLSSFPSAARLPVILLLAPIAVLLVLTGDAQSATIGMSLAFLSLLILRLLRVHDAGFTRLIQSRSEIAAEREWAKEAEAVAIREKAKTAKVAETDHLTELPNRRAVVALLKRLWGSASAEHESFAVALLDLDGFKPINDTFGHAAGDTVLRQLAHRLEAAAGAETLVGRMGGDEFVLILPTCPDEAAAERLAERACSVLNAPFLAEGREFRLSASCGVTLQKVRGTDALQPLAHADAALYRAKEKGRGAWAIFCPELEKIRDRRSAVEAALKEWSALSEIRLLYQPILSLRTMGIRSFEALARWESSTLGVISPGEFIPIAEQCGAISYLGERLFSQAVQDAKSWPDSVRLSFNLSAVQLCSDDCADRLLVTLNEHGLDPRRLKIEVTETALLADLQLARSNLNALQGHGVQIVLDDFGAGHASISYLREIQFDAIKLDGSLLAAVGQSGSGRHLLKGVLELCASLGTACVAECIETEEQLSLLRDLNCEAGQGFLLGKPMSAVKAAEAVAPRVIEIGRDRQRTAGQNIFPISSRAAQRHRT